MAALVLCAAAACASSGFTYNLDSGARAVSNRFARSLSGGEKVALISLGSSKLEEFFLDELANGLVASGRFEILDRRMLAQIAAERNFQYSGDVSDEDQQALGRMAGAQVIISTTVVELDPVVRFQVRAIAVESGKINAAQSVTVDDPMAIRLLRQSADVRSPAAVASQPRLAVAAPQSSALPAISIRNNTGDSVWYVYVSPASSDTWGADRLGNDTLAQGSSVSVTLSSPLSAANRYDIKLVNRGGTSFVKRNVTVSANSVITFTQSDVDSSASPAASSSAAGAAVDLRQNTETAQTVNLGAAYRRRLTDSLKLHVYLISVPAGTGSVTAWTEGSLDTRVIALTPEGLAALLQSQPVPAGAMLGMDDDSGDGLNARLTVTVPGSGARTVCFVVDEVNTRAGEYVFSSQAGSGSASSTPSGGRPAGNLSTPFSQNQGGGTR
jgi:hypothetical protein